jgi:hypothetical protein
MILKCGLLSCPIWISQRFWKTKMRRIQLDFIRKKSATPAISWVLLINGLVLSTVIIWQYNHLETQIASQTVRLDQLSQDRGLVAAGPGVMIRRDSSGAPLLPSEKMIGNLIASLESSKPANIAILDLEADAKTGQVTLIAQARTPQHMLDYSRRLKESAVISNVTITRHTTVESGSQRPIQFTIRLQWN